MVARAVRERRVMVRGACRMTERDMVRRREEDPGNGMGDVVV